MIQPWNLGPGRVDFSPLGQIGQTLGNAIEKGAQRQTLAALGQDIQSGNYAGAAQRAFSAGDAQTGLGLLKLGQTAASDKLVADTVKSWGDGQSQAPLGPPPLSSPGTGAAAPAVAVANNEDEVRRLEGSSGNTGQRVAARLVQNGLSPAAAAGIVSNLGAESSFNTAARNRGDGRDGSDSIGLAQWNGPRARALMSFAQQQGKDWRDLDVQTDFIAHELRTSEAAAGRALAAAQTPQDAGRAAIGYFRPGGYTAANPMGAHNAQLRVAAADRYVTPGQTASAADADMPAPGATVAQGFAIPGGGADASISNDPKVKLWTERLNSPVAIKSDAARAVAQRNLDMALKDAERRYNEGKAPESVREWQWARQNGLTTAKSPVEYARERAEATRADSAPTVRQLKQADGSEVAVQWNPETKKWDPLSAPEGGEAVRPRGVKLTEQQSKDLIYYNRGLQALEAFEPYAGNYSSGTERLASQVPGGNYVVSEEFQKAKQAGENFLMSILRKDTGAAITSQEQDLYGRAFLPQPGDKPGTLAQKAEARRQAIDALRGGLGPADILALGQKYSSRQPGEGPPAEAGKPAPQPTQFRDGQRARGPNGEVIIFRNGQWGAQ